MSHQEIERKWLMQGFPDLPYTKEVMQTQAYLSFMPAVRIRKVEQAGEARYTLTIKGKGTLRRTEVELPLSQGEYEALADIAASPAATKRLRLYPLHEGHVMECSLVDEGEDTAFFYAEVEFATLEQANQFVAPDFMGQEVTQDPSFTMAAYCRKKMQKKEAP